MSIVKLTENLENFKWTEYNKIGNNSDIDPNKGGVHGSTRDVIKPHPIDHTKFDDGVGKGVYPNDNPQEFTVRGHSITGNKTFDRPSGKSLENMVSEFGPIDTSSNRGPYKEVDYLSGRIGEWGPTTLPLGFTKDMVSSLLGPNKEMILTPLSYTIAGMNSSLHYGVVPEQEINIDNEPKWPSALGAWGSTSLPISTYTSRILLEDDYEFGPVGGGNSYYGRLESLYNKSSMFEDESGKYITPDGINLTVQGSGTEFQSFSGEGGRLFQRTFNIPHSYPNNDFLYSIDSQFGWSHNSKFLTNHGSSWRNLIDTETITTHHVNQYTEEEVAHLSDEEQDFYLSGQDTYTTTETISHPMLPLYISSEPTYNANSYLAAQFLVNYGKTGGKWPYKVLGYSGVHPLIRKDIGDRYEFGDGIDNWMAQQVIRSGEDITRIEKWLETPDGASWQGKQHMLQELNPREETRDWSRSNLIMSIPPLVHATRHFGGETYMEKADFGKLFNAPSTTGSTIGSILGIKFPKLAGDLKTASDKFDLLEEKFNSLNTFLGDIDFNEQGAGGRLRFLRNRFILNDTSKDSTINLGGLGDISLTALRNTSTPFGRPPKIPTQTTFSQRGAHGMGPIHTQGGESSLGNPIHKYKALSYGELGGKYLPHSSPLPSHGRKNEYDADAMVDAFMEMTEGLDPFNDSDTFDGLVADLKANLQLFEGDRLEIGELDKAVKKYKEEIIKMGKISHQIGDPGKQTGLTSVTDLGGEEGAGLGIIKKNHGQTGTPGNAYKSIATDKINIHPYGKDIKEEGISDFIKFKFKDLVNNKFIVFRAILSGISDSITPEWSGTRYIGRPDQVYVYSGTERKISFSFEIYPKTKQEFPVLLEKMNYLVGLCYPTYTAQNRMIAPFIQLTLGDMFNDTPGFLDSLSVEVNDNSTWEMDEGLQFPKHITCQCSFTYIGKYLPSSLGKHYELDWLDDKGWTSDKKGNALTRGTFESDNQEPTRTGDMATLFDGLTTSVNTALSD